MPDIAINAFKSFLIGLSLFLLLFVADLIWCDLLKKKPFIELNSSELKMRWFFRQKTYELKKFTRIELENVNVNYVNLDRLSLWIKDTKFAYKPMTINASSLTVDSQALEEMISGLMP